MSKRKTPRILEQKIPIMRLGAMLSVRFAEGGRGRLFWLCAGMLVCSLLLGGGTRRGFLSDAVLELIAIPVLFVSLVEMLEFSFKKQESGQHVGWALALCGAIAFVPFIQLIPLPPWLWTSLPDRERESILLDLIGRGRVWMPISMSPSSTWLSALSLLPSFAIFLSTIQLSYHERRSLSLIIIGIGILSAFVGLIQIAQGPSSSLRLFAITNHMQAVGFFANRNHFAALLYVVLLFATVWAVEVISWQEPKGVNSVRVLALTASFLILMLLIAAQAATRSRAGIALTIVALISALGLASVNRRAGVGPTVGKLIVGAATLAVTLAIQFGLYDIVHRFTLDPLLDTRVQFAHDTIEASKAFMPFGAGVGTFVPVYGMFESPKITVANTYANHAHNDILEVWLETGAVGIAVAGLFILWISLKSKVLWQMPVNTRAIDHSIVKVGIIAIGLLIAHSFVDYPLRTGALGGIFAFACALLVTPPRGSEYESKVRRTTGKATKREKIESRDRSSPIVSQSESTRASIRSATADTSTDSMPHSVARRGGGLDWSEQWQKQVERNPSTKGSLG